MGNLTIVHYRGKTTLQQTGTIIVLGNLVNACGGHRVHGNSVRLICGKRIAQRLQVFHTQLGDFGQSILLTGFPLCISVSVFIERNACLRERMAYGHYGIFTTFVQPVVY